LENDEKWNVPLYESQKVVVFNEKFLFLTFLTSVALVNMTLIIVILVSMTFTFVFLSLYSLFIRYH